MLRLNMLLMMDDICCEKIILSISIYAATKSFMFSIFSNIFN